MQAETVSGNTLTIPYRASSDATGGDVVVQSGLVGIVENDIDVSEEDLGALILDGVFDFAAESSHAAVAVGTDIYWDDDGDPQGGTAGTGCATTTDTGVYLGKAVPVSSYTAGGNAAAANSTTIRVVKQVVLEANTESS